MSGVISIHPPYQPYTRDATLRLQGRKLPQQQLVCNLTEHLGV
jgi:hypothetical protein